MTKQIKAWAVIANISPDSEEWAGVYFNYKAAHANKKELIQNWDMTDAKVIPVLISPINKRSNKGIL